MDITKNSQLYHDAPEPTIDTTRTSPSTPNVSDPYTPERSPSPRRLKSLHEALARLRETESTFFYTYGGSHGERCCGWNRARKRCEILAMRCCNLLKRLWDPDRVQEMLADKLRRYQPQGRIFSKFRVHSLRLRQLIRETKHEALELRIEEAFYRRNGLTGLRRGFSRRILPIVNFDAFQEVRGFIEGTSGSGHARLKDFKKRQGKKHPLREVQSAGDIDEDESADALTVDFAKEELSKIRRRKMEEWTIRPLYMVGRMGGTQRVVLEESLSNVRD